MENSMRLCDLRKKEVINCRDGERLGFISDLGFNPKTGCIETIIIPGPCKFWGFLGREQEYIIPWRCIRQIGNDVVLVDVDTMAVLQKIPDFDCD